ncbi:MAG: homoserine O-acetyltransferase [bacterium]|nr:homoserine O-acetyltransferase [bacterium]
MSTSSSTTGDTQYIDHLEPFDLEKGGQLENVHIGYRTWGSLSPEGDNAVLVCHALTGSADADEWWEGILGKGKALDPDHDFIVCSNVLGSCYGTTGPTSLSAASENRWGPDFPDVTVRDMVRLQAILLDKLGVTRLRLVIGGSLGGMQALEWAAIFPGRLDAFVAIATSGRHSPWCIGLSEAQRTAIKADSRWNDGWYSADEPPEQGLSAARMMAMCSYRSPRSFDERFGRELVDSSGTFQTESYLRYQGQKLSARFDANAYIKLTQAMDSHDLGRGRGDYREVLGSIKTPGLVVAIDSDLLYPPNEQQELAFGIPGAQLAWIHSPHGHDAFLIETDQLDHSIREFRNTTAQLRPRLAS